MSELIHMIKMRLFAAISSAPTVSYGLSMLSVVGGILGCFNFARNVYLCPTSVSSLSLLFPFVHYSFPASLLCAWMIFHLASSIETSRGTLFLLQAVIACLLSFIAVYAVFTVILYHVFASPDALSCGHSFCFPCVAGLDFLVIMLLMIEPVATGTRHRNFPLIPIPVPVAIAPFVAAGVYMALYLQPVVFPFIALAAAVLAQPLCLSKDTQHRVEQSCLGTALSLLPTYVSMQQADRTRPLNFSASDQHPHPAAALSPIADAPTHVADIPIAPLPTTYRSSHAPSAVEAGSGPNSADPSSDATTSSLEDGAILLHPDMRSDFDDASAISSSPTDMRVGGYITGPSHLIFPDDLPRAAAPTLAPGSNRGASVTVGVTEEEFDRALANLIRQGFHAVSAKRALLLGRGREDAALKLLQGDALRGN